MSYYFYMIKQKLLIGDDQFESGSFIRTLFEIKYGEVLCKYDVTITADPVQYVALAQSGEYSALMIDLRWGEDLPTHGYDILTQVREYAPVRVLWTSEQAEARERGYQFGATACIEKNPIPSELERVLQQE